MPSKSTADDCSVCPPQKHDTELGNLRLNVEEIARNKTMKDVWPLQNANKGDIELTLTFQPIIFEEDEAVRISSSRCPRPSVML